MSFHITEIAILAISYLLYKLTKFHLSSRAFHSFAVKNNCLPPPTQHTTLPYGLERYLILFTGFKGIDILETLIRPRFANTHTIAIPSLKRHLSTVSPENIKTILGTSFADYSLGASRAANLGDLIGHGIFTADGESWTRFRAQLKPQFTRGQIGDLEVAERHLGGLWAGLEREADGGWERGDLGKGLRRWTLDVSMEFLFGVGSGSQVGDGESEKKVRFAEAMVVAQETIIVRLRLGKWYWLVSPKRFRMACKTVKEFTGECVDRVLAPGYKPVGDAKKFVLMEELARQTEDRTEIRDQCLHLLLAGRDTTAALLGWCIVLLSRHPTEFEKLRTTVLAQFGTSSAPKQELTFESLKTCKELTHLEYETLRLYPIVPLNSRVAIRNTVLPNGGGPKGDSPVAVRKGTTVGYSTYVMHRRHDIWGEDADEFRPARWEGRKLGWEYIPFSGGARVCIGQQYALNEVSFVLVRLLQRYDKIESLDDGPIVKQVTMTLSPANVSVRMHRADA
ncbi:Cytochrome P450 [Glarea lozoyensis ATCC 20868]|uniref:Cytochrome P450 n=1 Tax=Glarea lozoyensis (strain ATCC 20868 / MF5171) TaxID=1116229 RepID=S3DGV1_GLAL2|nr:Cytochrome P450 [Glarea lozoyensis ATCC 20868]EPE36354.1 Cytochrome P450 [Glarea lozoyensis ATCC 20868]